jgi:hypothetical protein
MFSDSRASISITPGKQRGSNTDRSHSRMSKAHNLRGQRDGTSTGVFELEVIG